VNNELKLFGSNGFELIKALSLHLSGGTEENHEIFQSTYPVFGRMFKPSTSVMPQSSVVRVVFPKLLIGISPPEISAYDRVCVDRYVLLKGRIAGWLQDLTSVTCHFGVWVTEGVRHEVQNTTLIYTLLSSQLYTIDMLIKLNEHYHGVLVTLNGHYD
jgi:hypothetical protein